MSLDLPFDEHRRDVKAFVQQAFDEVAQPAVDARFALVDGELVTNRSRTGRELAIGAATDRIVEALGQRTDAVEVPVRPVEPSVTTAALGQSIVVDLSENHLYLYDGLKVVADYPVATAAAGYTTPVGTWEVVDKRENPTWYNPAQDTWGADLPPVIAPGPGQPAGHQGDLPQRPRDPHPRDLQLVVDRHVRVARLHPDVHLGFGGAVRPGRHGHARHHQAVAAGRSCHSFCPARRSALARTLRPGYVDRVLRGDQRGDPAATAEYISLRSVLDPTPDFPPLPRRVPPDLRAVA